MTIKVTTSSGTNSPINEDFVMDDDLAEYEEDDAKEDWKPEIPFGNVRKIENLFTHY